jgi:hypothetical protein
VDFEGALASSLASQFASAWAPPLGGLSSLDDLYGILWHCECSCVCLCVRVFV